MISATRTLTHCLSEHVDWHIARVQCVSLFILSMFACESVSLSKVSTRFGTTAKRDSHFKRLQRLLRFQVFDYHSIAKLVLELSGVDIASCTVAVDRTNWKFGALHINILVIGVVHGSLCIPVVFSLLPKQGNSNHKERKVLLKQFLEIIPASNITLFLADREFIGESWFKHLQKQKIPYVIRVKENFIATLSKKGTIRLSKRFANLRKNKRVTLYDIHLCGVSTHLAATRLELVQN